MKSPTESRLRRVLEIKAGYTMVSVWRAVDVAGAGPRWIADATDLRTGCDVGTYSHHATRERACRAASRAVSALRRAAL